MQTRRFGRTGHMSTVAILGGFVISQATPQETNQIMEMVQQAGVNHIDIAPTYGHAETSLGAWMKKNDARNHFFLGCKTMERTKNRALEEMQRSLVRLNTTYFDLYQIHAISTMSELDEVTKPGGAIEALIEARDQGFTRFVGITGHGFNASEIFIEALRRFDFNSILFPLNFIQYSDPTFRRKTDELIQICNSRDIGTMIIKSIAKSPWGEEPQTHITWYKPFSDKDLIQKAINFVLSREVTGICTAGDPQVLLNVLEACGNYKQMSLDEQESLISSAKSYEPLFV